VPRIEVPRAELDNLSAINLLSDNTQSVIFPSKGEARKNIQNGGVSLNRQKVTVEQLATDVPLLLDKYLVAQRGKKNYYLIKVV
jgi:tyrosyl-tRNA synthetase